jgi:hypothetical protein
MEAEDRFGDIAALIDRNDRANFGDGVASATITDAERRLNKTFPPSYRWWLETFGAGYIGGYELMGLCPLQMEEREPDLIISGDIVYQHQLNTRQALYPPHLIELLNYEGDEVYFFDASNAAPNGEWPVVRLCPGDSDPTFVATDFAEFLRRELA